jgi:hypothetical protein
VPPRFVGQTAKVRVLEGRLQVFIGGEEVAAHALHEERYRRTRLPEHEAEFRERGTAHQVVSEQFLTPGAFCPGLPGRPHRRAPRSRRLPHVAYPFSLAQRVGGPRVAGALRHAVRYRAFDAQAVSRIVEGKADQSDRVPAPTGPIPSHIQEYLRGVGEHQRPLRVYEELLRHLKKDPHGQ